MGQAPGLRQAPSPPFGCRYAPPQGRTPSCAPVARSAPPTRVTATLSTQAPQQPSNHPHLTPARGNTARSRPHELSNRRIHLLKLRHHPHQLKFPSFYLELTVIQALKQSRAGFSLRGASAPQQNQSPVRFLPSPPKIPLDRLPHDHPPRPRQPQQQSLRHPDRRRKTKTPPLREPNANLQNLARNPLKKNPVETPVSAEHSSGQPPEPRPKEAGRPDKVVQPPISTYAQF